MDAEAWRTAYLKAINPADTILTNERDAMYDAAQASGLINENNRAIDHLRHALAQERELADKLQLALQALMKDYIGGELDPRTDELLAAAMGDYRQARQAWVS